MPVTRRSARKAATRANTKRTILSALDENRPASIEQLKVKHNSNSDAASISTTTTSSSNSLQAHAHALPDINVLSPSSIHALLDDIKREVNARQECLSIKRAEIAKNQEEVYFLNTMKIEKSVKKMTVREFNAKFMNKQKELDSNVDVDSNEASQKMCIIDVLKSLMISNHTSSSSQNNNGANNNNNGAKKRVRGAGYTNLETPVRQLKIGKTHYRTPGTILRTVRKGEVMYSSNGSPLESNNAGTLVATVCKKRKDENANVNSDQNGENEGGTGENADAAAEFDINIGDGRYITLGDPSTMEHLTVEMKNTAKNQLHVLQDQLSKLLSHLN
uniref:Borealin N-terminal domain-containing protein n=1 Tax=Chaetoceros debilis TaxID=122233 RepID=A0A7S3VH25_9STRA|mmetsp:Transcript_11049/g.16723  ORF Transcript_11049/g.16723 Transcript_11049/m.16723 type:complete len:332 (+) Transcript_11049:467-1462(+)|eukprot:CAMPEP_0194092340 /NCGR_PEP_ID=MMETSP0149-20130528/46419_1 /TAXON_ID=122233 /ORGANISM="Chaetoceros debilis, Strain MM31A-1" /LENGTH=331 /DNA_ID=CAMNT_0038777261 /DNA_START=162 /DNA_END=1157 /DNA_ORIENTATION=-